MAYNSDCVTSAADSIAVQVEDLISRLGGRDRVAINKHLAICDAEADDVHGNLWRRLAGLLATLARAQPRRRGTHALQFLIRDGAYRKQVFALEDRHNGVLVVYLPDVLDKAVAAGHLVVVDDELRFPGYAGETAPVTVMTAANSPGAPEHVEHMLGWNRKAIRLVVRTVRPDPREITVAEALCRLAALEWRDGTVT
jgi:hypothetical protein